MVRVQLLGGELGIGYILGGPPRFLFNIYFFSGPPGATKFDGGPHIFKGGPQTGGPQNILGGPQMLDLKPPRWSKNLIFIAIITYTPPPASVLTTANFL